MNKRLIQSNDIDQINEEGWVRSNRINSVSKEKAAANMAFALVGTKCGQKKRFI